MLIGPARLCSMVSEHDDTLKSTPEQLTVDIFSVPNIQVGPACLPFCIPFACRVMNDIYERF